LFRRLEKLKLGAFLASSFLNQIKKSMTTSILTNKEGELYVWQKPEEPNPNQYKFGRANKQFHEDYIEACERAKAEAVKVVNPPRLDGYFLGFWHPEKSLLDGIGVIKPGEDLPLPSGLGVEIQNIYCETECIDTTCKLYGCGNPINGDTKVARIITKPVETPATDWMIQGKDIPAFHSTLDKIFGSKQKCQCSICAPLNEVEPIKEESQENNLTVNKYRTGLLYALDKHIASVVSKSKEAHGYKNALRFEGYIDALKFMKYKIEELPETITRR
jgi:hypothetical protein